MSEQANKVVESQANLQNKKEKEKDIDKNEIKKTMEETTTKKAEQIKDKLEEKLELQYSTYKKFLEEIYPGNNLIKDAYCKIISLIQNESDYLKPPEEQKEKINSLLNDYFSKSDEIPKFMKLYPDILQFQQTKELEYRNRPEEVKSQLIDYFIKKYFKINNLREKVITKSNQIINCHGFNQKFQASKDYKIGKLNTELDLTMKRLIRLMNKDDVRDKDFEYYLKHFKVKRIDSIFVKKQQNSTNFSLRKDDFEVYFRDVLYKNKITSTLKAFGPSINFIPIKDGLEVWKKSKIFLDFFFRKSYDKIMKNIQFIYKSEKKRCNSSDIKLFKEYFKGKYQFYYKIKTDFESPENFTYDMFYPPLIISINSEIRPYLKELCEYFNIPFDLSIDNGKAYSYSINKFYPKHFEQQTKGFKFNSYELTYNEISSGEIKNEKSDGLNVEPKTTEILRLKYNPKDGFLVNNGNNFLISLKHTSFKGEVFIKNSDWALFVCIFPDIDIDYQNQIRLFNEVGYIDSNFKYILEIIEKVDLITLNRLIEDYTNSTSSRIRDTIKLNSSKKEENEYSELSELAAKIIKNDELEKGKKSAEPDQFNNLANHNDQYADKVDSDLLKYLMTLRFLKLRDYKFYVLNLLNYFRYIQKKLIVDSYKIETKNIKKTKDLQHLTDTLSRTLSGSSGKPKNLVVNEPLSEFIKTNPIIPSLERIMENKGVDEEFDKNYLEEIDEIVEYSDKLIRIKDNKGNYIIYEATLSDMKQLEEEFCKIGTYYIQKKEKLIVDTDTVPNPFIDRTQVILDLFTNEFDFLYAKFEYISELMTIYENTSDIFEQKKLMKNITNVMSKRPHLDLDYNYFTASYLIESELLRKKAAFMHILIDYQKKIEMKENQILYDTIDKYYWLLGETALEIINHVNLTKSDIETLKQVIFEKKNLKNILSDNEISKVEELDKFIQLFTKLKKEKELEGGTRLNLKIKEKEEDKNDSSNSDQSSSQIGHEEQSVQKEYKKENDKEELMSKINALIGFMKKLFSTALTGGNEGFLEENINTLIDNKEDLEEDLKESIIKVLEEENEKENNNNQYFGKNISFSVSNNSLDLLNYEVRSLLNIPNPFLKNTHMNYIEKNPQILNAINKEINFIRFEEGYPYKYIEQDQESKVNEIEYFESLIEINHTFDLIEEIKSQIYEKFIFENDIVKNGLGIALMDYLIEDWEKFKDKFSGKKSIGEFSQVYYMQNCILDNYHSLMYALKNVSSVLSGPINRVPPTLLAYLPNSVLERHELEDIQFIKMTSPKDPGKLENLMTNDLEKSLITIIKTDYKAGWLDFNNKELDEVQIYCNAFEQYRMKNIIFFLIEKNALLSSVYESQRAEYVQTNEEIQYLKEPLQMKLYKSEISGTNYLDRYYLLSKDEKNLPKFAIQEFDPSLATCAYFKDLITVQTNFFNRGIDELKTFASYEYMNLFLLLAAIQYNNIIFFNIEKYKIEWQLYKEHNIILKNSFFNLNKTTKGKISQSAASENTEDSELKKIKDLKILLTKELFYNIAHKKLKNRNNSLDRYNNFIKTTVKNIKRSNIIKHIYARHERLLICNAYMKDIILEAFLDFIKIQACSFSTHLKRLVNTIPKEFNIFEVNELPFLENEKKIDNLNPYKNFHYFHDRTKHFEKFYIPSNIEILQLKNQTDDDVIYHYRKYNPFNFSEDITTNNFFTQLEELFYPKPKIMNKLEDSRNKFFEQAFSYQSNAFLFLKFCSFFIQIINIKYIEICLTQKPIDVIQILSFSDHGYDFWGDKTKEMKKIDDKKNIPLAIVEKIVDSQKNYLNLRTNFDTFKIDLKEIMDNIKSLLNEPSKLTSYMEQLLNWKIYHWYYLFNSSREFCLQKNDVPSFNYLTKIILSNFFYGKTDYFKKSNCKYSCHFSHIMNDIEVLSLFKKHMFYENPIHPLDKLYEINYYNENFNSYLLTSKDLIFNDNIKYLFPFITENKIAEIRNLDFKISSMTKNYLIYIEKSTFNSDLTSLNLERIKFLQNYIMMQEYKYKFLMILENDLLPIKSYNYVNLEKYMYTYHPKFNKTFIESLTSNFKIELNDLDFDDLDDNKEENKNKNKKKEDKKSEATKIFDNKREDNLKMKNTIIMDDFFDKTKGLLQLYREEARYILFNNSIEALQKENNAIRELFAAAKSDLDISKFRNRFSSNFLGELDLTQISTINEKYPYLENFVNKVYNVSTRVETHTDTDALLINQNEFDEAIKILVRNFIIYDSNKAKNDNFSYSSEKFGNYFNIKKLEIWLRAYKNKLTDFDNDLEKLSNAKFAIVYNRMTYEMDSIYRQLKVLKDNIKIMEYYIKDYYQDKFKSIILSFHTEMSEKNEDNENFRKKLVIKTNQSITDEYIKCINLLQEKTSNITRTVNAIGGVEDEQEKKFFDDYNRALDLNISHHEKLNKEREEIEGLQNDIAQLHGFYRMKLHNQKVDFENQLDNLKKNLSENKDLWDKLRIAERNEAILKEELSKTQKSLASAEEFIKRLRTQIKNSHDKNVSLQKKISQMTIKDIMHNAGKGSSAKAVELYNEIRQTYVYNMKNNVDLVAAIERVKMKYEDKDNDVKTILTNFEILHKKYAEEIDAKRNFISTLNGIKVDIQKMNAISNKKLEEITNSYNEVKQENENLKLEIDKLKQQKYQEMMRLNSSEKYVKTKNISNNISKSSVGSIDKFPLIESQIKIRDEKKEK